MKNAAPIAVTSRSFSRHPVLRAELLDRYENVTFNDAGASLAGEELVAFLRGKAKAITALERIDDAVLSRLPELEVISKVGVGIDMLDLEALERHGVRLSWTPGTNSRSVSELALALILCLLRGIVAANVAVREGVWQQRKGTTLTGKTVGIVGFGNVGRDVARLVRPFDCRIVAYDVRPLEGVEQLPLDELLRAADVVTLHLDLNEDTRDLLGREKLELMPAHSFLINTARGGLVDEGVLRDLLREGRIAGAAFDVFAVEPPGDVELLALPTFVATPHIGGSTEEAILAMGRAAIAGLDT
jgi:D-3-phosphoglycerate dehydrogenase